MADCEPKKEPLGDPDITGIGVLAATGAYVLLNFGTTVYAYLSWSLSNAKTNAFDNVVRLRPRWHWTALSRSKRRRAYEHVLEMLIPQHFCSFMAQVVWACVVRYHVDPDHGPTLFAYHMATCSILLSAVAFLLTAGFLGKSGLKRNPMRHVQVSVTLAVVVFTTYQYLATQSRLLEVAGGLHVGIREALDGGLEGDVEELGDTQQQQGKCWARATVITHATGVYLKVVSELYMPGHGTVTTAADSRSGWPLDHSANPTPVADGAVARARGGVAEAREPPSWKQRLWPPSFVAQYAFLLSAVVEEACSSFFARIMVAVFSMLLWATQLVLYPFIPGVEPNDHREPAISKAMSLGQISALVFLLDPLLVILNSAIGNTSMEDEERAERFISRVAQLAGRRPPRPRTSPGAPLPRPAPCRIDSRSTSPIPAPDEIRVGESAYEACLRDHFAATVIISWVAAVVVLAVALAAPILLAAFLNGNAQLGRDGRTVDDMLDKEQWRSIMLAYFVFSTTGLGLFLLRTMLGLWATWRRRMRALGRSRG
ncbi:hypothetical protein Purlil1_1653 [Purpureocillium lilacinum]|uniref:Uncharacterized protein n=1 Tax=Purpureocillium lilacinum TaxID=33203 RepID=A0ABR0CCL6_PURLI|nr:hypothetical protein Purlil1_1653 [Purpureocillium lilacinum]